MAESTTDHSILKKIEGLVHEEQHLYGKGELADHDQVRLEARLVRFSTPRPPR